MTEQKRIKQATEALAGRGKCIFLVAIAMLSLSGVGLAQNASGENRAPGGGAKAKNHADGALVTEFLDGEEIVSDEILVGFHPKVKGAERANIQRGLGAQVKKTFRHIEAQVWRLPAGAGGVKNAIAALSRNPNVRYAEPNKVVHADDFIPDDPFFSELWGMYNTGQTGGASVADISATKAWNITKGITAVGGEDIVVGVIDTGVDYDHPDLAGNMWTNPGEIPGNGIDEDNNGISDDIYGASWVGGVVSGDPLDDNDHGTHVSGTIGAIGDNGKGVAGVSWGVKIMALKFLSAGGSGAIADAVSALEYAIDKGANLTSNSWGGGGFSQAMEDMIMASRDEGMLFVAAAGNSNRDNDLSPHYPSSYEVDNVISVAATDHNDEKASFSSYGLASVDIAAPGVEIFSTVHAEGATEAYDWFNGTSMATPHVAGAAALAWNLAPVATYTQIKNAIFDGGDSIDSMMGITTTGKRLNVFNTLPQIAFVVTDSTPALCAATIDRPTDFVITFSHEVLADSLDVADLTVTPVAAVGVHPDRVSASGKTVTFSFDTSPIPAEAQGAQFLSIAAGAISTSASPAPPGGSLNAQWGGMFRYDEVILEVTGVVGAAITTLPLPSLTLQLNETIDVSTLAKEDFVISQGSVVSATPNAAGDQITLGLSGVDQEGNLTIELAAGALADIYGNPNRAWPATFDLDYGTFPLDGASLAAVNPKGSLIYERNLKGSIGSESDADSFTIDLDPGQTLAVVVEPDESLAVYVDVTGGIDGSANGAAGVPTQVLPVATASASAETFTVTIAGDGTTTGSYQARLLVNAVADDELGGQDPIDGDLEQDIALGFTELSAGASAADRAAVVGSINHRFDNYSVIEEFDSLSQYSEQKGNSDSNTSITAAAAHDDGGSGLQDETNTGAKGWIFRDQNLVEQGDVISVWVRSEGTTGRAYFGFGADSKGTLSMVMAPNSNEVQLLENSGYRYETIGAAPQVWQVAHWYRFEIEWGIGGTLTGRVYDNDGETLLNTVTATSTAFTSGGLAFRAFDSTKYFDTVEVSNLVAADVDEYAFELDAGQGVNVVLTSLNGGQANVELLEGDSVVGQGTYSGYTDVDQVIADFTAATAGTYRARVTGDNHAKYSLVVTRNAVFDLESNDGFASAQPLTAPTVVLGAVLDRVSPDSEFIEDFDDSGDLDAYTLIDDSGTSLSSAAAHDGTSGLQDETASGWIYRDENLVNPGDTFSVWIRSEGAASGRAYFGFGASEIGTYTMVMAPNSNALQLHLNAGFGFDTFASVPQIWLGDHWYRMEVEWHADGEIVGNLYDSDGLTLLNSLSAYDTTFDSGGLAFRAFGSTKHFDSVQRAEPNLDIYQIELNAGDSINLTTAVPAEGSGGFVNLLAPQINVYGPDPLGDGVLLAPGGGIYLAAESGPHFVVVSSANGSPGEYILGVDLFAAPGITVSPTSGLVTSEDGGEDTFTVVLDTEPAANVIIDLSSSDTSVGIVFSTDQLTDQLIFDDSNWEFPQKVTVRGLDDAAPAVGDVAYEINVGPFASSDSGYQALPAQIVSVTNLDNDGLPTLPTMGVIPLSYSESGGKQGDRHLFVTVGVESEGGGVANASVAVDIDLAGDPYDSLSGLTDGLGNVTFSIKNAPSGTYVTQIRSVTATGLRWDGEMIPEDNSYDKK